MSENFNTQETNNESGNTLSLHDLLHLVLSNWYWFIISVVLCCAVAVVYLYHTAPTYQRTATVLVKDSRKGSSSEVTAFNDLIGGMGRRSVDNELHIFKSRKLMEQVVKEYDLTTRYTTHSLLRTRDMYGRTPVLVKFLTADPTTVGSFRYTVDENENISLYKFTTYNEVGEIIEHEDELRTKAGDTITTPLGSITMIETPYLERNGDKEIIVSKMALNEVTEAYRRRLSCEIADKQASVISITMNDEVPLRAENVINGIIDAYNVDAIEDKQTISNITKAFINERLALLGQELNLADDDIANFKQDNRLYSPANEVAMGAEELKQLRKDALTLEANREMAQYILSYITDGDNPYALIPATAVTMSGASPALSSQIEQYNKNVLQYERLRTTSSASNPIIIDLQMQLIEVRKAIEASLASHIEGLNLQIAHVNRQQGMTDSKMLDAPTKEKELLSKARQQKVKEELYIYLLTKLEENALTGATAESNARIIDRAYGSNRAISPKTSFIYLLALAMGLAIPFAILYISEMLNTTVRSRRDIEKALTAPFLGDIPQFPGRASNGVVIKGDGRDAVSEAFRMVRTNLSFMSVDKDLKVIMLTSSIPHSGKTFVSLNLAATLANSGKRTLIIDIDLRRRTLTKTMGHRNDRRGMTSYISGKMTSLDEIICPSEETPNLDYIFSGPQPPNPTEMLISKRVDQFFEELRSRYDYIIIDSVPAMAVADAIILDRLVDHTIYVIRQGILDRRHLPDIENLYKENKFHNMSIILNGVSQSKHTYGYGYDYYLSSATSTPWQRRWKRFKALFKK